MNDDEEDPCQCMNTHAYISPIHPGHCCFLKIDATCHPDRFAVWLGDRNPWPVRVSTQSEETL